MNITCAYCAEPFTHDAHVGRPPGFCTPECKQLAVHDPARICRTCFETFNKGDSRYPYHCSEDCRQGGLKLCAQCGKPSTNRFCGGECLAAHYPGRMCVVCGTDVGVRTSGPYNQQPRFCSDECRATRSPTRPIPAGSVHVSATLKEKLVSERTWSQLWHLPVVTDYEPYKVEEELVPDINDYHPSAKVLNSIAWWNHVIPLMQEQFTNPTVAISYIGRVGWNPSDPQGCLSLVECWPWVTATFDQKAVLNYWRAARSAKPFSTKQILNRKEEIRKWVNEYTAAVPQYHQNERLKKFYKREDGAMGMFFYHLRNFEKMHDDPAPTHVYRQEEINYLNSDNYWDTFAALNGLRTSTSDWLAVPWPKDAKQPVDPLMVTYKQILEKERHRL